MTGLLVVLLLNIGLHTGSANDDTKSTCGQDGWVFYEESGTCFYLQNDLATYKHNQRTCLMMEARLAVVQDNHTADFLKENIDHFKNNAGSARVSSTLEKSWTWENINSNNTEDDGCISFSWDGTSKAPCAQPMVTLCMRHYSDKCTNANGGCKHTCQMSNATRVCTCHPGFILSNETQCTSVNPCEHFNGGCAQQCHNPTPGRKVCTCDEQFVLQDGSACALRSTSNMIYWKEILSIALIAASFVFIVWIVFYSTRWKSRPKRGPRRSSFRRSTEDSYESDTPSSISVDSIFDSNVSGLTPPLPTTPPLETAPPTKTPPPKVEEKPTEPVTPELKFIEHGKGHQLKKKKSKSVTSFFSNAKGSRVRIS